MTNFIDRRRLLMAGAAMLTACASRSVALPEPTPSSCRIELPEDWSGIVLVRQDGQQTITAQGALFSGGPRIEGSTRFNTLSLGKMMTGVLVGQLVDAGIVRYTDPVSRHLPSLPEYIGQLTVGELLTHTSGLGNYIEAENFDAITTARSVTELLPLVFAAQKTERGVISYCNSGYAVAGALIEQLTGMTYEECLKRRIFEPCDMNSASMKPRPDDALSDGDAEAVKQGRLTVRTLPGGPAGGAFMTAEDLARFAQALLDHRLTSPETFSLMTRVQAERSPLAEDGVRRGWGFGFGIVGEGASRTIGHLGGLPGVGAALRMRPSRGRIVVALANQDRVDAAPLSSELLNSPDVCKRSATTGQPA